MIFEREPLPIKVLGVVELEQENLRKMNEGRNFDALSFRFSADSVLSTEKSTRRVLDNYVCFVPANTSYFRDAKVDKLIAINMKVDGYFASDIECFLPQNPEKLAALFRKAYTCWEEKELGYTYKCTAIVYEILEECHKQNSHALSSESKIQKSVDYLKANFADSSLSIREIAAESFMSEVYFRKLFKKEYGTSPQKYIVGLRIQKATELIYAGYYTLKEIAYLCGYDDYKYFSTEFKRITGVSPSEYEYNFIE